MTDKLDVLLADGVIDEVPGRLKSGKKANISLVRRGEVVIAAKVYKGRSTRSFKNNAHYKEGRKVRNSRTQRAIDSGGRFGRDGRPPKHVNARSSRPQLPQRPQQSQKPEQPQSRGRRRRPKRRW